MAVKRGLRTWPKGAGWPVEILSTPDAPRGQPSNDVAGKISSGNDVEAEKASRKLAQSQETAVAEQTDRQGSTEARNIPDRGYF